MSEVEAKYEAVGQAVLAADPSITCPECGMRKSPEQDLCWLCLNPEEAQEARLKGASRAGRKRKYVKGTKVPIDGLDDVLDGLGEVIGNLREMDRTPSVMNSLIRAYQVAAGCFLDKQEREDMLAEIELLKVELGITDE